MSLRPAVFPASPTPASPPPAIPTLAARLLALLLLAGVARATAGDESTSPAPPPHVDRAVRSAAQRLVQLQESLDGDAIPDEWPYEGVYRVRGEIPIGYRVGGTAIGAWALLLSPAHGEDPAVREAVGRALDFVLEHLDDELMAPGFEGTYDVRGWGHIYALTFLLSARSEGVVHAERRGAVDAAITRLVGALQETAIPVTGGWSYSRRNGLEEPGPASPFMTAPALMALFEAARQGESVSPETVERALGALASGRRESGAIAYTSSSTTDRWPGAIGRTPAGEMALLLGGRGDTDRVRRALDAFFEHWSWLEKRRRGSGTHAPPYGIAPYYFFYAHHYAALAIETLPPDERESYRRLLRARLFEVQEPSGGWNDRVFARSENFGTAMSLLALIAPGRARPAGWPPPAAGAREAGVGDR